MRTDDRVTLTGYKDACLSDRFSLGEFFGTAG
jgi:hypothetical protein